LIGTGEIDLKDKSYINHSKNLESGKMVGDSEEIITFTEDVYYLFAKGKYQKVPKRKYS
jgi:hypothetical protein